MMARIKLPTIKLGTVKLPHPPVIVNHLPPRPPIVVNPVRPGIKFPIAIKLPKLPLKPIVTHGPIFPPRPIGNPINPILKNAARA